MTQKQLFNQVADPIFTADSNGLLIHRIGEQDDDALWAIHLWATTNFSNLADAVGFSLVGAEIGQIPTVSIMSVSFESVLAFPGDIIPGLTVKLADGLPLRGPLDLWVFTSGGNPAPAAPIEQVAYCGYVVRGDATSREERRFFNISGPIGDQVTDFSGGQDAIAIPLADNGVPVDIHETDQTYIDEITLDAYEIDPVGGGLLSAEFEGGQPFMVGFGAPGTPRVKRILDGLPVRNAGTLSVTNWRDGLEPMLANGYFVRS